jgi:hypothetical protein
VQTVFRIDGLRLRERVREVRTVPTRQSKCCSSVFTEMRLSLEPEAISCEIRAMSDMERPFLRRDKAALSGGCKLHPATAPAGSNRSSHGGNEVAESFD